MFPQELPTPAARGNRIVVAEAHDSNEAAATSHMEFADHGAFGAQGHSIRGVLNIAAGNDATIVDQRSRADSKLRVGHVGVALGRARCRSKCFPVDGRRRHGTHITRRIAASRRVAWPFGSVASMTVANVRVLADFAPRRASKTFAISQDAVLVVGFALLTALAAQIEIPLGFTPVPLTGQTFAVLLAGAVLGARRGALSQGVYWVMGLVGLPFYSGGVGGWEKGTGATMGYLVGFIVAAGAIGYLAEQKHDRSFVSSLPAMLLGSTIIYACGATWLAYHLGVPLANGEPNAIGLGVAPFLVGDLLKALVAAGCTSSVWAAVSRRRG